MFRYVAKSGLAALGRSSRFSSSLRPKLVAAGSHGRFPSQNVFVLSVRMNSSAPGNTAIDRLLRGEELELKNDLAETMTETGTQTPTHGIDVQLSDGHDLVSPHTVDTAANDPTVQALMELIPDPPAIPSEGAVEAIFKLTANGEASLDSVGMPLTFWPSSWVQHALEWVHCDFGLPWWSTIAAATLLVRFAIFPFVIKSQRTSAKMHNVMPGMQVLQMKINEAKNAGDQMAAYRYMHELQDYLKRNQVSFLAPMGNMAVMMPIFMSFFFGLKGMANLPVESMKTGGLAWFTDLTVADPTYILPAVTAGTMYLTMKFGVDAAALPMQSGNMAMALKYMMMIMPVVVFVFTMNFPAAMLCYWVTSNGISLGQAMILKYEPIRQYFNIPKRIKHNPDDLPMQKQQKQKGFLGSVKENYANMKIQKQIQERDNYDAADFARAASVPLIKTYKYDPTKVKKNQLKKKE